MKTVLCIVSLFLVSCASSAGAPFPFSDFGWGLSEKKIIDKSYLQLSSVVIGTTTLDEVAIIFGQSEVYKPNKKNYSPNLLCYKSEIDDASIVFQSGPLGGWKVVTAIWVGKADLVDEKRCVNSKLVDREKANVNGLSLGLGADAVKKIVGKPTFRNFSFMAYRYESQTVLEKGKMFDVSSGFEFEFSQNQLSWFRVYQELSN